DLRGGLDPVARHMDVEQANLGPQANGARDCRGPVGTFRHDAEAAVLECEADAAPHRQVVVRDQHRRSVHGNVTSIVVPCPRPETTRNSPPSASARSRMLVRPKPPESRPGSGGSKPRPLSIT